MTIFKTILYGAFEAANELLPLSRAAHVSLFSSLGISEGPGRELLLIMRAGTLAAVLIYYAKDIGRLLWESALFAFRFRAPQKRRFTFAGYPQVLTLGLVAVACIPMFAIYYILRDMPVSIVTWLPAAGVGAVITGLLALGTWRVPASGRTAYEMNHRDAFLNGIMQGVALIAGLPRTALTIVASLASGIERKEAVRFSYFLLIPVLVGKCAVLIGAGVHLYRYDPGILAASFVSAVLFGLVWIGIVEKAVDRGLFPLFGVYLVGLGLLLFYRGLYF